MRAQSVQNRAKSREYFGRNQNMHWYALREQTSSRTHHNVASGWIYEFRSLIYVKKPIRNIYLFLFKKEFDPTENISSVFIKFCIVYTIEPLHL